MQHMEFENTEVKAMRDRLEEGILAQVPNAFVTGNPDNRLPNTANIAFEYIEGEGILLLLNKRSAISLLRRLPFVKSPTKKPFLFASKTASGVL